MKKFKPYVDTHIHTHYSVLDGVSSPEDNVIEAKNHGAPGLAISDHGTVAGIFEFYNACKKHGMQPLIGNELYMKDDLTDRNKERKYHHGVFIAMNNVGFRNLLWLSSKGFEPDTHYQYGRPVVSFEEIFEHSEGLAYSTGCMLGILGTSQNLTLEEADLAIQRFKEVFDGRMFIEIGPAQVCTDWGADDPDKKAADKVWGHKTREKKNIIIGDSNIWTNCLQEEQNHRALHFSKKYDIPLIVASDGHMCKPELKPIQDLLITSSWANKNGWHFDQIHSMLSSEKTWEELKKHHSYISEIQFEEMIDNTYQVLDLCKDLELNFAPLVPKFPVKIHPQYKPGMTSRDLMMAIIKSSGRMKNDKIYLERLQEELKVICDNGITDYTDYFLILSDIARGAREAGVGAGPARGSAGGCLLSYLLGITAIDPIRWKLSFTRFLNEGRVKKGALPDIDMDFTDKSKVIEYVFETYGTKYSAMVGSFQTTKTKGALKDIVRFKTGGKLSNKDPIHKLTKTIGTAPQYYPGESEYLLGFEDRDGVRHPGHLESNSDLRKYLDDNQDVKYYLFNILQKPRSLGRHAGGMVITPMPIDEVIPTRYYDGQKCTQVDYKTLEKIGGMKIDILGINTLNWIWDTVDLIKERHREDLNPWELPIDSDVFDMISKGQVQTVFQMDTSVVRPFLKMIKPKSIEDLAVVTSVCRPGALGSKLEDGESVAMHFVMRRLGNEPTTYLDPILAPVLGDTHGVPIYQEQIQRIFEVVGGLSPVESDNARRAVGKKLLEPMLEVKAKLYKGAQANLGWDLAKCERLWNSFEGSVNYSFNKAHATAYAIIAYACAYLKHHYKLEWWCSVLSNLDNEKIKKYLKTILKITDFPHVNSPESRWIIKGGRLQAPLGLVRSVAGVALTQIAEKAPYATLEDFFVRVNKTKVNKTAMLNMAVAGCFDGLPLAEGEDPEYDTSEILDCIMKLRNTVLKKKNEQLPKEYKFLSDRVKRIQLKSHTLPIATFDILTEFLDIIESQKDYKFTDKIHYMEGRPIVANFDKFEPLSKTWSKDVAAIGIVQDTKMFYYNDKSGTKKGALRLNLENDGRITEVVLWDRVLAKIDKKDLSVGNLIAIYGQLKYNSFKDEVGLEYRNYRKLI